MNEAVTMGQDQYPVVLDVSDVAADGIIDAVVDSEDLPAFRAASDLVLSVDADGPDLVPGYAAPVDNPDLLLETGHGPVLPIEIGEVPCHASLVVEKMLVILILIIGTFGFEALYHVIEEVKIPINVVRIHFRISEALMGVEIGCIMSDGPDLLIGMDLLDDLSRMVLYL